MRHLDKRCPPSVLPSATPHTSCLRCARLRRVFSSVETRVCGSGADEGGSHRVETQDLMRVEVHMWVLFVCRLVAFQLPPIA